MAAKLLPARGYMASSRFLILKPVRYVWFVLLFNPYSRYLLRILYEDILYHFITTLISSIYV